MVRRGERHEVLLAAMYWILALLQSMLYRAFGWQLPQPAPLHPETSALRPRRGAREMRRAQGSPVLQTE